MAHAIAIQTDLETEEDFNQNLIAISIQSLLSDICFRFDNYLIAC